LIVRALAAHRQIDNASQAAPACDPNGGCIATQEITIMERRFATLDVFTERRFAGNPLAIVLEAGGLDQAEMQEIAREFNLSETVFLLPPNDPAHRTRYRIFTPKRELAFAGHPTVGTAVLLGCLDGGKSPREFVLEANIGPVSCRIELAHGDGGHASFELPALPSEITPPPSAQTLAIALGLTLDDIGFDNFIPSCWSAGVGFTFAPLRSLDAVRRAKPNLAQFETALNGPAHGAVFIFSKETIDPGHDFHARMFAPAIGVFEDPATGGAAAAFAGVLTRFAGLKDGNHNKMIEQGYEMGRPSLIGLALKLTGGALTSASISGAAVMVTEGTIEA
jgi:trans-2,3-dihydro-3-hydroxyanthranilate isomerase